jgi:ParB family transcriptional regulator, chromosome partitioning protein
MPEPIIEMDVSKLKPNPINDTIYENNQSQLEELKKSIEINGLLEPLVVTRQYKLISGHRRWRALTDLGVETCDVRLVDFDNELLALVELNKYRKKTSIEILKEAEILKEEYKKQIKLGRPLKGETREGKSSSILDVANSIGVSTTKLKKYKSIAKHEPSLLKDIDLGLLSVEGAYQIVREKYIVGEEDKKYDDQKFSIQMKRLLDKYSPSLEMVDVMVDSYRNHLEKNEK